MALVRLVTSSATRGGAWRCLCQPVQGECLRILVEPARGETPNPVADDVRRRTARTGERCWRQEDGACPPRYLGGYGSVIARCRMGPRLFHETTELEAWLRNSEADLRLRPHQNTGSTPLDENRRFSVESLANLRQNGGVKTPFCSALILLASAMAPAFSQEAARFHLHDGDRVVFYGDSITDQRLYTTYIESYIVTRFPKMSVTFVHSGWGGDRVTGGGGGPVDVRLDRDVIEYKPTVVTIMLGMNDGSYRAFDQGIFATYTNGMGHILEVLKRELPGLRVTLIEPSPFDDATREPKFPGGYNEVLVHYGEYLKRVAEQEHDTLADLNTPVVAALRNAFQSNPSLAQKLIPDRVHPGPAGHLLMAEALLLSWGAPSLVLRASLDAAEGKLGDTTGCLISNFKTGDASSWDQLDAALPMPIDLKDNLTALALKSSDFMEKLDQETLKVANLKGARYELRIDGKPVGNYSKEDLAGGINLAAINTPMLEQALAVHKLTLEHDNLHFNRWRQMQLNPSYQGLPALPQLLKDFDRMEEEIVAVQRRSALPVSHHFELAPVNN
jgi:lysophospholipase L1-like esterase